MISEQAPLLNRNLNDDLAFLTKALPCINQCSGKISVKQFLLHCQSIAQQLPAGRHVVNLCDNRYLFLVAFCAVILRNQTNLLPPNKNVATQALLSSSYEDCYLIHDGQTDIDGSSTSVNITEYQFETSTHLNRIPQIDTQHLAAISFTSGSTGDSKPNQKYWKSLKTSSDINYHHMVPIKSQTIYQVATVPAQHMWGLETSVFMPLHHNICVADSRPLYPQDVIKDLNSLPEPRMLVTTPTHLRSLTSIQKVKPSSQKIGIPKVLITLCATSPLSNILAKQTESLFDGELREIYGCSEVGSMAFKRTSNDAHWHPFDGINFKHSECGVTVTGEHLYEETMLQDKIETTENGRFILTGRSDDMIDIAGKRGSLADLNQILFKFEGIIDGLIFFPDDQSSIGRLAAIVVLEQGFTKNDLRQHFRTHVDSAFVPRPIIVVDKLPRQESGKLPKNIVLEMYKNRKRRST